MAAFVVSGGLRRAQASTATPMASIRTMGSPSPRNRRSIRRAAGAPRVQRQQERQRGQPDEGHAPLVRRRRDQRGQVGRDRPLARERGPQARRAVAAVEQEQRARTDGHADRGRHSEQRQRPAPAGEPGARAGDARGQGQGQDGNQRHQEARGRALPAPPHPPGQHRRDHGRADEEPTPTRAGARARPSARPGRRGRPERTGAARTSGRAASPASARRGEPSASRGHAAVDREGRGHPEDRAVVGEESDGP